MLCFGNAGMHSQPLGCELLGLNEITWSNQAGISPKGFPSLGLQSVSLQRGSELDKSQSHTSRGSGACPGCYKSQEIRMEKSI